MLFVEYERGDAALVEKAFEEQGAEITVRCVDRPAEAVKYLEGREPYASRGRFPHPHAVMLDLKVPGLDALDFLHWIANSPFREIPVFVCTRAEDPRGPELARAHSLLVHLLKPSGPEACSTAARRILEWWHSRVSGH